MSQPRQFHMVGGDYNGGQFMNDTTYTKIFVGGLAWETQRDTMKKYFEQFGEILEAAVITDKSTGRSKGYGFVTFKDPEAAFRACQNPSPMIDGRRANCNLASLGAQKNRPPTPQHGPGRFRPTSSPSLMTAPTHPGLSSSTYFHQPSAHDQPPFPYSAYGYTGYSHDHNMYHMNYYGVYGQQYSPYYPTSGALSSSGAVGYFHSNLYPYYAPYAQSSQQGHGFGVQQYPNIVQQYPLLPQHYFTSTGMLSPPTSTLGISTTFTGGTATLGALAGSGSGHSQATTGAVSEQNSSN